MENDDELSDIELDLKVLVEVRDVLLEKIVKKSSLENTTLISSLLNVIKARQETELLHLRLLGLFDGLEQENCPECNELEQNLTKLPNNSN